MTRQRNLFDKEVRLEVAHDKKENRFAICRMIGKRAEVLDVVNSREEMEVKLKLWKEKFIQVEEE